MGRRAWRARAQQPRTPPGASTFMRTRTGGALFGLAGSWLVWDAAALKAAGLSRRPVWRTLLILVLLHPVLWFAQAGMLAWQTHLGGFLAGAVLAKALGSAKAQRN